MTDDSRYHRQRAEAREHPNRKIDGPHHDTSRPYPEVAAQIQGALGEFRELIEASSLGTPNAKRRRREAEETTGLTGAQRRIDEVHQQEHDRCHFCGEPLVLDDSGMSYTTEVGEFWSNKLNDSVLAHPDCLPGGFEAVATGTDLEWSLA